MIEQRNFWSLGRIFRTMPERFLRIPRRALHFAIGDILLFYNKINPSKGDKTRLTYNCAHLRSTKESLTGSVKNLFVRKKF